MAFLRKYISFHFVFFIYYSLNAQNIPDISGYWNGAVQVSLGSDLITEYYFTQNGAILEGYSLNKSQNQKDSTKVNFSGTVNLSSLNKPSLSIR